MADLREKVAALFRDFAMTLLQDYDIDNEIYRNDPDASDAEGVYADAAIAALAPPPVTTQEVARVLLDEYDGFMSGNPETENSRSISDAACFAAAAYEQGSGGQAIDALARAFLIALIDPSDAQLDYLRADPSAGKVAREAIAALDAIAERFREIAERDGK